MKSILVACCLSVCMAFGSAEIGLAMDRVVLSSSKHKLEVAVTRAPEGGAVIAITHEGEKFEIPKAVMAQFPDIQLRSVRILTNVPAGHLPDDWLKNHEYVISFDYGDEKYHGREEREVEVFARGRLICRKASYSGLEKIIPEGDHKNRWKLYQPMELEGDGFNGTEDGIECPIDD